jgi:hypothetical protein
LSDPVAKAQGRKEHHETVESGDTGGGKRFWLRVAASKATALRSAPSKDRQIERVYIAIRQEGKAGKAPGESPMCRSFKKNAKRQPMLDLSIFR